MLKTLRATVGHSVASLLERVTQPTLVIWGANDRVLSDVPGAIRAAERILRRSPGRDTQVRPRPSDRESRGWSTS